MRTLANTRRVRRSLLHAVETMELDLDGVTVLTEAASGPFVVTALAAALAGADQVIACTRDSRFGTADEVRDYTGAWAADLGVASRIDVRIGPAASAAPSAELVTNLGFVRPIDADFVAALPTGAAVSLMFETWEHRTSDVDLGACRGNGVPVLGTRETDQRLQIFRYLGPVVVRLLFEAGIEVFRSRVVVVGSPPFGTEAARSIAAMGGETLLVDPAEPGWASRDDVGDFLAGADAVVLAEHRNDEMLIAGPTGLDLATLRASGAPVVHLSGAVDEDLLLTAGVAKVPPGSFPPGRMTVTTGHVGPRPVIDLHVAGLKVGEALVRGMRRFGDAAKAEEFALAHSPAMTFDRMPLG